MARRIAISSGHSKKVRGASADPNPEPYNDEVDEVRKIVDRVNELLHVAQIQCVKFHDDVSTSQSENLNRIVNWHNQQSRDLDVSVHLNANNKTSNPMGCEILYVTQESLARETSKAIAAAGHFKDRGPKYRSDLAFLNGTAKPAILLECWFCDSSADCKLGRDNREAICQAIAEKIAGVELDPVVPPEPEKPVEPPEITEKNRVDVVSKVDQEVTVVVNGVVTHDGGRRAPKVEYTIQLIGDVILTVNGEEFHNTAPPDHPPPLSAS
jgi:N-acetylmuramoyl-L-alanine amidase